MCGIAGVFNFDPSHESDPSVVRKMTASMSHRGPDADGFYVEGQISLGHRRLSIIDLSECSNQPFADATNRYQLIFNGEIYNFREIKATLSDYPFKTTGDTEVLIAAYAKWGAKCLHLFKGMFSFAIWDAKAKQLFIARDRMGVKPLYYFQTKDIFLFASEIRGLLASCLVPRKLNYNAIREFLYFQSIGHPHSAVSNVFQLEAGAYMYIDDKGSAITKYWDITQSKTDFDFSNTETVYKHIRELLRKSVERRLISDVPLGAFLSGGIDSSAIVGLMTEVSASRPNTFTVGFNEKKFDESGYALIIAKKFNTKHENVFLKPSEFLGELTNALNVMDSPTGDGVNTFVVSKAIKNSGLTVALSGIGGDELFAGYPFFKQYFNLRKLKALWRPGAAIGEIAAGVLLKATNKSARIRSILKSPSCTIDRFYPEFRRILSQELVGKLTLFKPGEATPMEENLISLMPRIDKFPGLSQVSIAEYLGYTQHTLLKDTDQMSMAVSLEVREPFFDHDLLEYVLAIPDRIKYPFYPKSLLVKSLKGLLPQEIVHRRKQGFLFPWSVWMKNELKDFCERHIDSLENRNFIEPEQLKMLWRKFLEGDKTVRWMEVWLFVILEYWLQKNSID